MSDRLLTDMNLFAQVRELMAVASKFYQKTHYIASEDANGVIDVSEKAQDAKTASIKDAELAEKVEESKKVMLGKLIIQSIVRNQVDVVDKKRKPFRKVDMPVEWWDSLLE